MCMQLDVQPLLLAPGEGEKTTDRPERQIAILCDFPQIIVSRFRYEPGEKGPDAHVHRQHSDAFYVLEGEVEFGLGPEVTQMSGGPGTFAAAPPNVVHTFRNSSDATPEFLNIHAPSMGFGDVLRATGSPIPAPSRCASSTSTRPTAASPGDSGTRASADARPRR